ncbi:MAG: DUF445 family protein [Treponema sp.]|jgi:uncharacterized membrane protein YheB (UPF0754 family)|nr:DUF445 family protein [Treponema sp.]
MNSILIWLIPPLVGAVIGYITNAVAIKMLFRPLEEIRIFGIRLPFTPGILPRQRHKLADNIGAIVEQQLLTPEILMARLRQEDVRINLKNTIAGYTERLSAQTTAVSGIYPKAAESLIAFMKKPEIHRLMEIHGRVLLNNAVLKLPAFQRFFLSAGQFEKNLYDRMPEIIDDLIRQMDETLKGQAVQKKIIEEFLQKKDGFDSVLCDQILALAEEHSASLLKTINVRVLVSDRINSLDMLSVEHIVLDVMANQLMWISLFGAILGALIGLFQSIFSWFIR